MQHPAELSDLLANAAWLRRLAGYLARGTAEAPGDLVQDTWVAALRSPPARGRAARPWLATVLRNVLRRRHRDRERLKRREAASPAPDPASPSPEDLLEQAQAQQLLGELVLGLDEPYRTTVLLRYFEGLAPAEIAARTREPAGTVRWRLNEALRRLRAEIAAREGSPDAGRTLRALIPLLPAPAPATFGSWMKGGTMAAAMTAKTKVGTVAALATLALGVGAGVRLYDRAPPADTSRSTPDPQAGPRTAGPPGGGAARPGGRIDAARAPVLPKLQISSPLAGPAILYGETRPIGIADLPPHFRSVLDQIALGRPIVDLLERRDRVRGATRTRLSWHTHGVRHEVMLDEQGKLVASEVEFEPGELPAVVVEAIKTTYPEAVIVKADRQWRDDTPVYFDVNLRQDGRLLELHLSEEGRITKTKWK